LRKAINVYLRNPDGQQAQWDKMPRGLGDDYTVLSNNTANPSPRSFLSLTRIQFAVLQEWANDRFIDDWPGNEPSLTPLSNPTPDDLDKAAVEYCVGGPFYPGIEVSWLIRVKDLFTEPFRLNVSHQPEDSNASTVEPLVVGALKFRPGFFSQQMALPWQADFYDCHKERWEDPDGNEFYFMWWSAQRPDDVYPSGATTQERWVRKFDDPTKSIDDNENDLARFISMQSRWFELKFISVKNNDHYEEEP
jgi:phage terminase large subunit-like protein